MVARTFILIALVLLSTEALARFHLRWGDPVLFVAHPSIEYMLAPNQDANPYGKRQLVNQYGMRSADWPQDGRTARYLVFGDSVLNGGTATDHAELATTVLSTGGTFYGNVSANSWGPANMAAWLAEFGDLGAAGAIVLISSHDANDVPSFADLDPASQPTRAPLLALAELSPQVSRRLPLSPEANAAAVQPAPQTRVTPEGLAGLRSLLDQFEKHGLPVCLIQHQTRTELAARPSPGWFAVQRAFEGRGWPVVQMERWTGPAITDTPGLFTDDIHLEPAGQKLIAEAIKYCTQLLAQPLAS